MTPTFRIVANGTDLAAAIVGRVRSISVTDEAGFKADMLELTLADTDPDNPIAIPSTGAELEAWLGYLETGVQRMGLFIADEVELSGWPGEMVIRARGAPYDKSSGGKTDLQTQKTRAWPKGTTLGAMVSKIAKEHGLKAATEASLASVSLPHFDQTDESDISFLVRVCAKYDAAVKPGGGKLAVTKRGETKSASGEDMPTVTVTPGDCAHWAMSITTRDTAGTVVAYYHDRGAARRVQVTAGSGDPVRRLRQNFPDQASAKHAAQGELDKRDRRKNRLHLTIPGDPLLAAEANLRLVGFRQGVLPAWVVTSVRHHLDVDRGYSCELEAERPKDSDAE